VQPKVDVEDEVEIALKLTKRPTRWSLVCWSSFKWFIVYGWNVSCISV
jgi:hypothetical protein